MTDDSLRLFQPDDGTWEELCRKIRGEAAPFYLFHEPKAREHVQALRRSLGGTAKIAYAMKANPWLARATGADYIEVCSPTELDICARQQIPGKQLLADGIWQSDSFLERALKMGVGRFAVQSCSQLERLLSLSRGRPLSVLLRVTSGNQFGMDCEELKTCLTAFGRDGRVKGLQYYPGTQRRDIRQVRRDLACLREWISGCEHLGAPLEEIEFGAGIGTFSFAAAARTTCAITAVPWGCGRPSCGDCAPPQPALGKPQRSAALCAVRAMFWCANATHWTAESPPETGSSFSGRGRIPPPRAQTFF